MTLNQDFFDAMVRHQVDLLRLSAGLSKRVHALLSVSEKDIRAQIERRLKGVTGISRQSLKRLQQLEAGIKATRLKSWEDVNGFWVSQLRQLASAEQDFLVGTVETVSPFKLDLVTPSVRTLQAAVISRPFQGRSLKEWAKSAQTSDLQRMNAQIRIGMVNGEPIPTIVSRVLGAQGATNLTRHQATAVTRTAVNHVSSVSKQLFSEENADIISEELFVATLDGRTTMVCMGNDGKRFAIGKGPRPPLHVSCRSLRVALFNGEVLGDRPFIAVHETGLLREYAQANGLDVPARRALLPHGHKGKFERFARKRAREMTGIVPAKETYQQWLGRQAKAFQVDTLGPKRAKLFADGGLKLDKFTDRKGGELTLAQLKKRYQSEWKAAGL